MELVSLQRSSMIQNWANNGSWRSKAWRTGLSRCVPCWRAISKNLAPNSHGLISLRRLECSVTLGCSPSKLENWPKRYVYGAIGGHGEDHANPIPYSTLFMELWMEGKQQLVSHNVRGIYMLIRHIGSLWQGLLPGMFSTLLRQSMRLPSSKL